MVDSIEDIQREPLSTSLNNVDDGSKRSASCASRDIGFPLQSDLLLCEKWSDFLIWVIYGPYRTRIRPYLYGHIRVVSLP